MGPVEQQKRELCKQAYLLIHKYLAAAGKEGQESFEFRKNLRKKDALDIDLATNKEVLSELNKFKEQGGAALLTSGAAAYGGGDGAAKTSKSKGGGSAAGGGSGAGGVQSAAAKGPAKPSKSAPKSGSKSEPAGSMPATLPQKIGAKCNRWWAKEGQWYTAVITDYNQDTNEYRLTYNLGSSQETYEDFDLDMADPAVYAMTGERVNLLSKTGSAAVNNSVILQPYLARSNTGAAAASGGGSKSGKKRRSEDSDSDYGGGS